MASTLTSPTSNNWEYDAYFSFRVADTRTNFLDHLQHGLISAGITTFKDYLLNRESAIQPQLLQAISESRISIVVFSQAYAYSRWCLEELAGIMECRDTKGQKVVPIFCGVDPSEVKGLTGKYGEALRKHREHFSEETVLMWKKALIEVADLPGWNLQDWDITTFIKCIVRDITDELLTLSSSYNGSKLVGIASHMKDLDQLLNLASNDVKMVGIHGMAGIGKTTIAKLMYERISGQFEASCFLANVGDKTRQHGLASLERELLSQFPKEGMVNKQQGSYLAKEIFKNKTVLLVLDDVDDKDQLESLAGELNWFGLGSRVIITTRDVSLLDKHKVTAIYQVDFLDEVLAAKLFSWHAFKQNQLNIDYQEISKKFISHAGGLPLALEVLATYLYGRSLPEWESAFENLQQYPDLQIQGVLQRSFDGLNSEEKQVFLDIACFFEGHDKDDVINNLNACGFNAAHAIEVLKNRSLLTVTANKVSMHRIIKYFGMEIVQKECQEPHGRSRLWTAGDILYALRVQRETKKVVAMSLEMCELRHKAALTPMLFKGMDRLRLLRFFHPPSLGHSSGVLLPDGLHYLPEELRYLRWDSFPSERLPSNFSPTNLVELRLPFSKVTELWTGKQHMPYLRLLDLRHSNLIRIPDLLEAEALERIYLSNCKNLIDVSSIQYLKKLEHLDLKGCTSLQGLPNIEGCVSLTTLNLSGCSHLMELPKLSSCIKYLYLEGLPIKELHPSIKSFSNLVELDVRNCQRLKQIHVDLYKLTSLKKLRVAGSHEVLKHLVDQVPQRSDLEVEYGEDNAKHNYMEYIWDMVSRDWMLLYASLIIEGASAVFEQLQCALTGMIMAFLGLLLCVMDLTFKARKEQATWEWRGFIPWIYSHHPQHKLFGAMIEYFGLAAAIWQVFHSTLGYIYALQKLQNPIHMTVIMILFCLCQLIGKLIRKYSKQGTRRLDLDSIVVQNRFP